MESAARMLTGQRPRNSVQQGTLARDPQGAKVVVGAEAEWMHPIRRQPGLDAEARDIGSTDPRPLSAATPPPSYRCQLQRILGALAFGHAFTRVNAACGGAKLRAHPFTWKKGVRFYRRLQVKLAERAALGAAS